MKNLFTKIFLLSAAFFLVFSSLKAQSYFTDDFEDGLGKWIASGQDWDTTAISKRAGNCSITESKSGNYPDNVNEGITTAIQINLTTASNPILTFWHRYSINNGRQYYYGADYGRVYISKDNGLNWTELKAYSGWNTTWNLVQLDLKSYTGSKVKIKFQLSSNEQVGDDGWYIDDVSVNELDAKTVQLPFTDDFENGLSQWLLSGQDWAVTNKTFRAGSNSIHDHSTTGNYPTYSNETIRTASQIDLTTAVNPILTFWHKYSVNNGRQYYYGEDVILVYVSTDNGFNWTELKRYTGWNTTWNLVQLDLKSYAGSKVKLLFQLSSNEQVEDDGWYIDDVSVNELDTKTVQLPFTDDFENGLSQWLLSGQDWAVTNKTFRAGSNSIHDHSTTGNYPTYSNETIRTASQIDLTTAVNPILTFWHKYSVNNGRQYYYGEDVILVYVSTDNGFNWTELKRYTGYQNNWSNEQIDLKTCVGSKVKLLFQLNSNEQVEDDGWYIDDILISDGASLRIISPNGGEIWKVGEKQTITWVSAEVVNVKLEYSTDNGSTWNFIANTTANNPNYSWTVPNISSNQCKIRITNLDDESIVDVSDAAFTITDATTALVSITSPNGGENWQVGASKNITWASSNVANVKLEYTTDNGTTWLSIIDSLPASAGTYLWTIPNTASTNCKVRISDASDATVNSVSANVFTISAATTTSITLITPNGGENWQVGSTQIIRWTSNGVTNVRVEYSTNNGTNWLSINASVPAISGLSGGITWGIPNVPSSNCKIKISDAANSSINDESDNVFTISVGNSILNGIMQIIKTDTSPTIDGDMDAVWSNTTAVPISLTGGTDLNYIFSPIDHTAEFKTLWDADNFYLFVKVVDDTLYGGSNANISSPWLNDCVEIFIDGKNEKASSYDANDIQWRWVLNETVASHPASATVPGIWAWKETSDGYNFELKISKAELTNQFNLIANSTIGFEIASNDLETIKSPQKVLHWWTTNGNTWKDASVFGTAILVDGAQSSNILVTSPNGGENWPINSTQNITWTSTGVDNVKIEYTASNGMSWATIITNLPAAAGTYSWVVPNTASTNCKVRISNVSDATINSISANVFTISASSETAKYITFQVDLTSTINEGIFNTTNHNIYLRGTFNSWDLSAEMAKSAGTNIYIKTLQLSSNSLYEYKFYINSYGNDNEQGWEGSVGTGDNGNRILSVANSDIILPIVNFNNDSPAASLTLTQPNGGENWVIGSAHNITWTSSNVTNVKLEYTTDNGTNWSTIVTSTSASGGTYAWTVPNTASTNCKVRISDASDATISSISANVFTISASTLNTGLVAYYPFNGNTNDESGNGNNGTVNGATLVADRFGSSDKAYSFNGSNNYIDCGNNSSFNSHGEITVCAWVKAYSFVNASILAKWKSQGDRGSYVLSLNSSGQPRFAVSGDGSDGSYEAVSNLQISNNIYYYVSGLYRSSDNTVRIYVNGIERGTKTGQSGSIFISDSKVFIGALISSLGNSFFDGEIDDIRIYNRALSETEIQQLYSEGGWPLTSSVALTSPIGGDNWVIGSSHNITWTSSNVTNVKLEYTTNNGTNWQTIIASTPASGGTYAWTIPNTTSTNCKVRISDVNDATVNSVSSNVFTISAAAVKTLSITKPVGGENWQTGTSQSITWGSANITNVKLEYTTNNGTNWSTVMASTSANTGSYTWSVPSTPSANCKVKISDAGDATLNSISGSVFTIFSYPSSLALNTTISFSGIDNQNYYKIVGLPGQTSFGISTILASNGTQKTDWNVYWDNGASTDYYKEYDGTSTFNFTPGNAFWVISKNPITVSKTVNTVTLTSDQSYSISLRSGWNLISNPFGISVSWNDVKTKNSITQPIWSFVNSYTQSSTFDPYVGYYYYNSTSLSSIKIPYKTTLGKVSAEKLEGLRLSLKADKKEVDAVEMRYDERSTDGLDNYDIYSPGDLFVEASMSIVHSKGRARENTLKEDVRPALGEGQEYILQVKNAKQQKLNLSITEKTLSEPVYIIDDELRNVEEINGDVKLQSTFKNKTYRLIVGKPEYIAQLKKEYLPTEFQLYQNYPNPFNPITTIRFSIPNSQFAILKIYDVLGREISTLVNENKTAGTYEVEFNASNIPSGVYLYRLQSGENYITKKLMLLK